ncbi:MAG: aminopeptidase, partial [Eubacteriales bacterium]
MTNQMKAKLEQYAALTVRRGVNVAEGQTVCVSCPVGAAEFGRMVADAAYDAGAREVVMLWNDEKSSRMKYMRSPLEVFESVPEWAEMQRNGYARGGAAMIHIISEDPDALAGVDGAKLIAATRAGHAAYKEYYERVDHGEVRWSIVAYPCAEWARRVYPGLSDNAATEMLWRRIFETVRIGRGDPAVKWEKHDRILKGRAKKLNSLNFSALRCENSLGTSITVGLADRHIWKGGSDRSADGRDYFPNMPTEEIFTMPHREHVDGIVYSALPLSERGQLIDKFWLR